jgi:MFS transporter, DHA2 family, multidrug resistance protein
MLVLLAFGPRTLPETHDRDAGPVDIWSVALSLATILPLIFALKHVAMRGLGVAAIGFVLLAQAAGGGVGLIVVATVVSSVGLAPVFNLSAGQAVEAAPVNRAGAASALSETSTELGFALGIALLGSVAGAIYRGGVHVAAARESLGAAIGTGDPAIAGGARDAFVHAVSLTSALSAAVAVAAAGALVLLLTRDGRRSRRDAASHERIGCVRDDGARA